MNNRVLKDTVSVSDKIGQHGNTIQGTLYRTDVVTENGVSVLKRTKVADNTIIIGGTQMIARALVESPGTPIDIHTLDAELSDVITPYTSVQNDKQFICAFGVFNGGANGKLVANVDRSGCGFTKANLIPFRMMDSSKDNITTMMEDYACRTVEGSNVKYYLKKIKNIQVVNRTVDGVELPNRPDINTPVHTAVETVIKFQLTISLEDLAEYYASIGETLSRKFSSIGIFVGNKVDCNINGHAGTDHRKLMVTNALNINEEIMSDNKMSVFNYEIVYK